MTVKLTTLKAQMAKAFPNVWVKMGEDFSDRHRGTLWTGEGSSMPDGMFAFDMYSYPETCGIHPTLDAWLTEKDYYIEAYDGGTYFIYANR